MKGGQPAFLPDTDIWVMNADGSGQVNLTPNSAGADGISDWSADASQLVFRAALEDGNVDIYVMDADGSDRRRLTDDPGSDSQPRWSPDGARIVFVSVRTGNNEIFVMDADGSNEQQLTNNPARDDWPVFTPEGDRILFTSNRNGASALYNMPAAGGVPTKLTADPLNAGQGDYSPGGLRIAFVNNLCSTCGDSDIFAMNDDGSEIVQLTRNFENNLEPKWSPDGTKLVFWNSRSLGGRGGLSHTADIFVINADGTQLTNVTKSPGRFDVHPDWGSNTG